MTNQRSPLSWIKSTLVLAVGASCILCAPAWAKTKNAKSGSGSDFFQNLPPPEDVRKDDFVIGPRLGVGSYASAGVGFGVNGEYMVTRDIGVGGAFGYSAYSTAVFGGNLGYTNLLVVAQGSYHANLLKVRHLDTFATVGLGYDIASASWSGTGAQPASASASGVAALLSVSGRYFFNEQFAAVGSLGIGMGILGLGVDYKF